MISETPQRKKEWLKNMQGKILKNTLKLRRGILTAMPKAGKIDEPRLGGGGPSQGERSPKHNNNLDRNGPDAKSPLQSEKY